MYRDRRFLHGPGEAVVTPQARSLITQKADESIGYIEINIPGNNGRIYSDGTGFRVGDTYMMSAFHVFEGLISLLLEEIIYKLSEVPSSKKCHLLNTLKHNFGTGNEECNIEYFSESVTYILKEYLKITANDTENLLSKLTYIMDMGIFDGLERKFTDIWRQNCTVNFMSVGEFLVDWRILFGDKDNDIIIVNLLPTKVNQTYPTAFMLDEKYRQHGDIQIIRYHHRESKAVIIDQECDVFQNEESLRRSVDEAVQWWTDNISIPGYDEAYYRRQYESCRKAVDEDTGRVILKSSESFIQGSSGSPVTYLLNQEGVVIVQMIYQGGFPPFYYETDLPDCFGEKAVPAKCFFGRGTTMKKLSQDLVTFGKIELKRKLFTSQVVRESRQNALSTGDGDETDIPLQRPADIGESNLHEIARRGQIKMAELFLKYKAPVNKVNNRGESVLHYVIMYDSDHKEELANLFIEADGGLVNVDNIECESLLHYTARFESEKNLNLARFLTEKGASVNCENKEGESLLHYTTRYSQQFGIQLTDLFLEHEAPVDKRNKYGESILHYTAKYLNNNDIHLATIFIGKGAPKTNNHKNESLLHYTVKYHALNKQQLAALFIEHGVSVNCSNTEGKTLLDYITNYLTDNDEQLVEFLLSKIQFGNED